MPKKLTTDDFAAKAKKVHGDRYDYSQVVYVNSKSKVKILCSEHGCFEQWPSNHLNGQGCPKCGELIKGKARLSQAEFIERATKIHDGKYDYSKAEYTTSDKKVTIICPIHGEFLQTAAEHLFGKGCAPCGIEKRAASKRIKLDEFL